MTKIIDVNPVKGIVSVVLDNGLVEDIDISLFRFKPEIGKEVEVFKRQDGSYIINEIKRKDTFGLDSEKHKVGKTLYLLMALFLGGFGVHKFITGRILVGVIFLLFCWTYIPAIISFLEFVVACTKQPDENGMIEVGILF